MDSARLSILEQEVRAIRVNVKDVNRLIEDQANIRKQCSVLGQKIDNLTRLMDSAEKSDLRFEAMNAELVRRAKAIEEGVLNAGKTINQIALQMQADVTFAEQLETLKKEAQSVEGQESLVALIDLLLDRFRNRGDNKGRNPDGPYEPFSKDSDRFGSQSTKAKA